MNELTTTLLTDGSSDRVLLPIINFLLDELSPIPHRVIFAQGIHSGPLTTRLRRALSLYPCDVLFIHRDAEAMPAGARENEIREAVGSVDGLPHSIRVIPVRMTETWLLTDSQAIRKAAGNPSGTSPLKIPATNRLEQLSDPKTELFNALRDAADLGARRQRQIQPESLRHRVAELMEDIGRLRALPSFKHFEAQVAAYFQSKN